MVGSMARLTLAALLVASIAAPVAHAQTVADIAARGACSTAGVEGLSDQLVEAQMCADPGAFVEFAPHAGISLTSSRIHPFLQRSARDAVWSAASHVSLDINSAFRTLADQYVLYESGGCGLAATPGRSNHETGLAIDVNNYGAARSALEGAGCSWLGSSDPVHFDCPGSDGRAASVRTFQHLWNLNHPGDVIDEDGVYGPQTGARLGRSPAGGFPIGGCAPTCSAHCEGTEIVGEDCGRGDCAAFGAYCSTAGAPAPHCVSVFCVAGADETPSAHDICLPDGQRASCDAQGAVVGAMACGAGTTCVVSGATSSCVPDVVPVDAGARTDAATSDASTRDASTFVGDAGPMVRSDGGGRASAIAGGCGCHATSPRGATHPMLLGSALALLFVVRRRAPR
jgi:MYXO-CTERM domain-containing protein